MQNEIAVRSGVSGLQKRIRSIEGDAALRAQDIKIDAYYDDTDTKYLDGVKLHYTGGDPAWQFWNGSQVHYYWPFEGSKTESGATASTLDFVGACPFTAPSYITSTSYAHASGASFTCDISSYLIDTLQRTMQEYVIAVLPNQTLATQTEAGGALPMSLKHPFALVKFVIASASGEYVTVDSIAIDDLHTGGTCTYNGTTMSWAGTGTASMALMGKSLHVGGTTESDSLMVIPDSYGTKTLSVRGSWTEWSTVEKHTVTADVAFNWQPGYVYVYNLTVSKYALKVDVQQFTEQW